MAVTGVAVATTTAGAPLCAASPGPAPLRRITRFEYGRALADLTGVDPSIAQNLPPDEETMDFDDIATAYSVSSLHAQRYLEVARAGGRGAGRQTRRCATTSRACDPTSGDAACVPPS